MRQKCPKFNEPVENVGKVVVKLNGEWVATYYVSKSYKDELMATFDGMMEKGVTIEYLELTPAERLLYGV